MPIRGENSEQDATLHLRDEVIKAIDQTYPLAKAADGLGSPLLEKFRTREVPHLRFAMPTKLSPGPVTEIVMAAIDHTLDVDDVAFGEHGANKHKVFPEAGSRLKRYLTEQPGKVGVALVRDRYFNRRNEQINVEKFELSTPWEQRNIYRPLFYEVAYQISTYLTELQKNPSTTSESLKKKRKKMIVEVATTVGVDFAVLVCLCLGMSAQETQLFFTDTNLENKPAKSRTSDFQVMFQAEQLLRPNRAQELTFDREQQDGAVALVQDVKAWGKADERAWTQFKATPYVSSLAYFGGATYQVAHTADQKVPDLRDPALTRLVREYDAQATTNVLTMYNVYHNWDTGLVQKPENLEAYLESLR